MFYVFTLFSVFINNRSLYQAFGFHKEFPIIIGFILFSDALAPMDTVIKLLMNILSRTFEFQAGKPKSHPSQSALYSLAPQMILLSSSATLHNWPSLLSSSKSRTSAPWTRIGCIRAITSRIQSCLRDSGHWVGLEAIRLPMESCRMMRSQSKRPIESYSGSIEMLLFGWSAFNRPHLSFASSAPSLSSPSPPFPFASSASFLHLYPWR